MSKVISINENAHSKIMKSMIHFLDDCKNAKTNCECSGILKFNPDEINENKKWSFLYQCDANALKVDQMEYITLNMLNELSDKKEEIYNVDKK